MCHSCHYSWKSGNVEGCEPAVSYPFLLGTGTVVGSSSSPSKPSTNANGNNTDIALGIHAGDHAIYPDCRQEFRDADDAAFRIGNWEAEKVGYFTPYLDTDKLGILKDGQELVKELGITFDEVYKRTNTSYKPFPSGNSDYKSASSVERIEAFINLGVDDPVQYEDETGEVEYSVAKAHVEKLLAQYA